MLKKRKEEKAQGHDNESKKCMMTLKRVKKVVENKVFNRTPPMFSCIRLQKRQQCCKPKIGGESSVTNKLSSKSSKDQIQYRTIWERSIM